MSTYVISDIHGCYNEFMEMLQKIKLNNEDKLYLAGDYVDRGPDSTKMLRWLENCSENVFPIKGNHDVEFVENVRLMKALDKQEELETDYDSVEDTKALYDSVKYILNRKSDEAAMYFDYYGGIQNMIDKDGVTFRELLGWAEMIRKYPFYHRFMFNGRDTVIVHAGFIDDPNGIEGFMGGVEEFYLYAREESITDGGVEHGMIIAGHTPTIIKNVFSYNEGKIFRHYDEKKDCIFYDIDCGAVFRESNKDAHMACLRLEDEEAFYL